MAEGFLLVDKPAGLTSHDVVARVRRLARMKKVGHAGTLDPAATGLLILALGRVTRLIRFVQEFAKEYVATAQMGVATDTLDADGAVLSREPMPVSQADVESVLGRFTGDIMQVPPMVSALRVDGRRLYELAREGKEVERAPRPVTVYELELQDFAPSDYPELTFRVRCSKGTYVRSLADDIARSLGGRAHLTALRRTAIGTLSVADAHTLARLDDLSPTEVAACLSAPAAALAEMPAVTVEAAVAKGVSHGTPFPRAALPAAVPDDGPFLVLDEAGALLAVYRAAGSRVVAEVVTA